MSCVHFLCDVFRAFHIHICLYFDLAAGGYSGEIQELVSVKIVLNILLTNFGVGFFGWGFFWICLFGWFLWGSSCFGFVFAAHIN